MALTYGQRPRIVVEESPLARFFGDLPNTLLAFMQLNQQMEQMEINRDYASAREDLKFARQDYLQTKAREDAWRDTLAKAGYSTKHITGPGAALIESNTQDIVSINESSEQNISELQSLTAELSQWKQKGVEWEKTFAAFEEADKDVAWKDLLLEGGLSIGDKGQVVGTGEFAEVLKSLSPTELDKLKDENYRQAVMEGLRDESAAIKMFGQAATGTAAIAKIGQGRYVSNITNALNTAETYSGISAVRSIEADIAKFPDESGVPEKKENVLLNKLNIGREYTYLITGMLPSETIENASEETQSSWMNIYNRMSLDLSVAKPKYATGGFGSTTGNQKNYNETLAHVYLNYQQKLESDPAEASIFAAKTLQYFGVDITDPSKLEDLGITDHIEATKATRETLSSLSGIEDLTNDPLLTDSLINENLIGGGELPSDVDESLNAVAMAGQALFPGQLETKYRSMDYELAYGYDELSKGITQQEHLEHRRQSLIGATLRSDSGYDYKIEDVELKDPDRYVAGDSPFLIKLGGVWSETAELPRSLNDYTIVQAPYAAEGMPTAFTAGPIGYYWDPMKEEYRIKKSLQGL